MKPNSQYCLMLLGYKTETHNTADTQQRYTTQPQIIDLRCFVNLQRFRDINGDEMWALSLAISQAYRSVDLIFDSCRFSICSLIACELIVIKKLMFYNR